MGCACLRGDGHHWPDRGARRVAAGGWQQGGVAYQPDAAGPDARSQFLRPGGDADAVRLSDGEEQPDAVPDPNAISDRVTLGQSIGYGDRRRLPDAMPIAVCHRDVIGVAERQRETFGLALARSCPRGERAYSQARRAPVWGGEAITAGGGGRYIDSWAGFTVQRPAGWQVRVRDSVISVWQDAAALVHAIFYPVRFARPISPSAAAQEFIARRTAVDPTFQALVARQEPLVLRTESHAGGRMLNGLYSVVTQGENGLISGFQVPREQAESLAPVLGQVVASFSTVTRVPREQFREPVEGAFTVLYPQGWSVGGSVNRANAYGGAMPGFQAANGATVVENWPRTFSFAESMWLLMPGQQKLKYLPAAGFAGTWLPGWLQKQAGPLTVDEVIDRPDQVPQLALEVAKAGMAPDRYDLSCATLQFTQVRGGREFRSRLGVVAQRSRDNGIWSMSMNPTAWSAIITSSMQAPAEEFDGVAPMLSGMLDSFQKNPQWESAELMRSKQVSMQMQQQALARLQQISSTLSQTTDIITSGFWERQAIQDRVAHTMSNAILGRMDVVDQGTVYSVPNDYAMVWRDPQGNFIGTPLLLNPPDPSWVNVPIKP